MKRIYPLAVALTLAGSAAGASQPEVSIGLSFTSSVLLRGNFSIPPDTMGAVGPDHIVELINGRYTVFDKTSGTRVQRSSLDSFWTSAGVSFEGRTFDPRVLYDDETGRWYATAVDNGGLPNSILMAVSCSEDPTAGWIGFAIDSDSSDERWADFPTLGFNDEGIFVSTNMFPVEGSSADTLTVAVVSVPKNDFVRANHSPIVMQGALPALSKQAAQSMVGRPVTPVDVPDTLPLRLPGVDLPPNPDLSEMEKDEATGCTGEQSVIVTIFENIDPNQTGFAVQPVIDNSPDGEAAPLLSAFNTPAGFFKRSLILNAGSFPVLDTRDGFIEVTRFDSPPPAQQPGPKQDIDSGDTRFSSNLVFQNGSYWGVQTIESQGRAALRWFEIDGETLALRQQGLISDPDFDFYYGSLAINPAGHVVIGFSGSSESQFVSTYVVAGTTQNGETEFGHPILVKRGRADYERLDSIDRNRWGDYSATVVDPEDPFIFWTFQEYVYNEDQWGTEITEILFPEAQ